VSVLGRMRSAGGWAGGDDEKRKNVVYASTNRISYIPAQR